MYSLNMGKEIDLENGWEKKYDKARADRTCLYNNTFFSGVERSMQQPNRPATHITSRNFLCSINQNTSGNRIESIKMVSVLCSIVTDTLHDMKRVSLFVVDE